MFFSFFYKQRKTLTEKFGFKGPESRNKEPKTIDFYLFVCLFIYLFIHLFIDLFTYLFIYLFVIYLFTYFFRGWGGGSFCETKVKWIMVIKKFKKRSF